MFIIMLSMLSVTRAGQLCSKMISLNNRGRTCYTYLQMVQEKVPTPCKGSTTGATIIIYSARNDGLIMQVHSAIATILGSDILDYTDYTFIDHDVDPVHGLDQNMFTYQH